MARRVITQLPVRRASTYCVLICLNVFLSYVIYSMVCGGSAPRTVLVKQEAPLEKPPLSEERVIPPVQESAWSIRKKQSDASEGEATHGYQLLLDWAERQGIRHSYEIRRDDFGQYCVADHDIMKGENVLFVPKEAFLSDRKVMEDPISIQLQDALQDEVLAGKSYVAFWIYHQGVIQENRYLDEFIPKSYDHVPYFYPMDLREQLAGTRVEKSVLRHEVAINQEYGLLLKGLEAMKYPHPPPSLSRFALLSFVWISRNFRTAVGNTMMPLADLVNHARSKDLRWGYNRMQHAFEFTAVHRIPKGAPLHVTYGSKGNEILLSTYGFTIADNHDRNGVRFMLPDFFGLMKAGAEARSSAVSKTFLSIVTGGHRETLADVVPGAVDVDACPAYGWDTPAAQPGNAGAASTASDGLRVYRWAAHPDYSGSEYWRYGQDVWDGPAFSWQATHNFGVNRGDVWVYHASSYWSEGTEDYFRQARKNVVGVIGLGAQSRTAGMFSQMLEALTKHSPWWRERMIELWTVRSVRWCAIQHLNHFLASDSLAEDLLMMLANARVVDPLRLETDILNVSPPMLRQLQHSNPSHADSLVELRGRLIRLDGVDAGSLQFPPPLYEHYTAKSSGRSPLLRRLPDSVVARARRQPSTPGRLHSIPVPTVEDWSAQWGTGQRMHWLLRFNVLRERQSEREVFLWMVFLCDFAEMVLEHEFEYSEAQPDEDESQTVQRLQKELAEQVKARSQEALLSGADFWEGRLVPTADSVHVKQVKSMFVDNVGEYVERVLLPLIKEEAQLVVKCRNDPVACAGLQ